MGSYRFRLRKQGQIGAFFRLGGALIVVVVLVSGLGWGRASAADYNGTITAGGSSVTVTLGDGDKGNLTFSGTVGERVFVDVSGTAMGGSGIYNLDLLDPSGSTVKTGTLGSGGIDTATLSSAGTYTIRASPAFWATGTLTFKLYDVPADVSGSIVAGGSSVSVTLSSPGQNGTLTFSGSAGDRVSMKVVSGTLSSPMSSPVSVVSDVRAPGGASVGSITNLVSNDTEFMDVKTLP